MPLMFLFLYFLPSCSLLSNSICIIFQHLFVLQMFIECEIYIYISDLIIVIKNMLLGRKTFPCQELKFWTCPGHEISSLQLLMVCFVHLSFYTGSTPASEDLPKKMVLTSCPLRRASLYFVTSVFTSLHV